MPEGPEARRVCDQLRAQIKGRFLLKIELYRLDRLTRNGEICENHKELINKWPQISGVFPSVCLDIITRGKQIYFFFENGIVFNSGLGIEGHWYLDQSDKYTDFCLIFGQVIPGQKVRLEVEEVRAYYDDKLRYGLFNITDWPTAIKKMMTEYGPDYLNVRHPQGDIHPQVRSALPGDFFVVPTREKFCQEISMARRSRMPLCTFLLTHQEYFSGVGNWILNEVCYFARIHPCRLLGAISQQEAIRIFDSILDVISRGYQTGGLTHGSFLDPHHETGKYVTAVYKRAGQLDMNGFPITQIEMACKRNGFIVAALQH